MNDLYVSRPENVFLKKEQDIHISRFLLTSLLVLLPAVLLLLLLVHWQNQIYKHGYDLTVLEHNRAKLENRKLELLAEKERLLHPARLDAIAEKNKLKIPERGRVVTVDEL